MKVSEKSAPDFQDIISNIPSIFVALLMLWYLQKHSPWGSTSVGKTPMDASGYY